MQSSEGEAQVHNVRVHRVCADSATARLPAAMTPSKQLAVDSVAVTLASAAQRVCSIRELVDFIVDYAVHAAHGDLFRKERPARLRRVNQTFKECATPYLFEDMRIAGTGRQHTLNQEMLNLSPPLLGTHVTKASVALVLPKHEHTTWKLLRLMSSLKELELDWKYQIRVIPEGQPLLSLLPRLERLSISEHSMEVDKLIPPSYHAQALGEPLQPIELRVKIHTPSAISYVRSLGGRVARLCLVGPLPSHAGAASNMAWQDALRSLHSLEYFSAEEHQASPGMLAALPPSLLELDVSLRRFPWHRDAAFELLARKAWLPNLIVAPRFYREAVETVQHERGSEETLAGLLSLISALDVDSRQWSK